MSCCDRWLLLLLLATMTLLVSRTALPNEPDRHDASGTAATRAPKVGLVLAGGGAKGGAHVGVLKVLEEMRIPIDCIAGTSMGALVGAGYASGIPAAQLETFVTGIDWQSVVGGVGRRDLEPIEQKRAGTTYSNQIEFGIGADGVKIPAGLVNTSNIEDLLRSYVAAARLQTRFDGLPIPYRAVATDMVTGQMVVLDRGDLATAMRASMAIPGAFAPVVTERYILADGGLVRNIPIDVARDLCADTVIVVNLVEPAVDRARLQSAGQLLSRTLDVMIEANETLQLQTLRPQDVRIDVPMGDISTEDFERVSETIPLGEAAARAVAGELSRLAVTPAQYSDWRLAVTAEQDIDVQLADVRFEGLERANPDYLAAQATLQPGDRATTGEISIEARRMAALQDFESVAYRIDGEPRDATLVWLPIEKRWGPDFLRADLGVYGSAGGDTYFTVYGRHTRPWLNNLGAEWRNEVQLGRLSLVAMSLFQPLSIERRFFVEPQLSWSRSLEDVFSDGERIARYQFDDLTGRVDFGLNVGSYAQVRLGYRYDARDVEVDTGSILLPEIDASDAGITVTAEYDTRDTPFNPTRGVAVALEYIRSDDALGADRDWQRAELGIGVALPVQRDVVWVTLAGGSSIDARLPADRAFALGGPGSFPGFELGELRVDGYWTLGTSYLWKIKDTMSIRGQALYAGVRLIGGQTFDRVDGRDDDDLYGASVYLSGRTLVGPLTVGLGGTSTDSWSLWFAVGRPIGSGTILERGIFR